MTNTAGASKFLGSVNSGPEHIIAEFPAHVALTAHVLYTAQIVIYTLSFKFNTQTIPVGVVYLGNNLIGSCDCMIFKLM